SGCPQAIRAQRVPPNASRTTEFAMLELPMGYASRGSGFMVGWSPSFLGLSNSQMVVSFLPVYHWCLPFFFQPYSTGSCCHWYGERPSTRDCFFQIQQPDK